MSQHTTSQHWGNIYFSYHRYLVAYYYCWCSWRGLQISWNEYLHVSNKNRDICRNDDIDNNAHSFETPIKHNHGSISLTVKDSK